MTTHIPSERLHALVFDNQIDAATAAHLADCPACRQQVEVLRNLRLDLEIARRSTPAPDHLDAYRAMFANVQTQPSPLQRLSQQIRALLTWDSRTQPALMGVRSGNLQSYRQLYVADDAEIELLVERVGELRNVKGDVIDGAPDAALPSSLLVELLDPNGEVVHVVEADAGELFHFDNVAPGLYNAVITRSNAAMIELVGLEIA
jgi:anti-sigma factor RsiW